MWTLSTQKKNLHALLYTLSASVIKNIFNEDLAFQKTMVIGNATDNTIILNYGPGHITQLHQCHLNNFST